MIKLAMILDTMLPGDPELGLPPGSSIDFSGYVERQDAGAAVASFRELVEDAARQRFDTAFFALNENQRLIAINACQRLDLRLFAAFVNHVLRAYYTDTNVLQRISTGAVPAFPDGNPLDDDDWTILEPVYERGPIYREVGHE